MKHQMKLFRRTPDSNYWHDFATIYIDPDYHKDELAGIVASHVEGVRNGEVVLGLWALSDTIVMFKCTTSFEMVKHIP